MPGGAPGGAAAAPRRDRVAVPVPRGVPAGSGAPEPCVAGADVLRALGLEALVQMLERSAYGVCITGEGRTWVYANPAATRYLGRSLAELRGRDYLECFPEHERPGLLALEQDQRAGDTGFYTNTIVRPDGTELEMTWSGTAVEVDGTEYAPAVFHETEGVRQAQREAAALATAAARMVEGGSAREVLEVLASEAVAASRASSCVFLLADAAGGTLRVAAGSGVPPAAGAALDAARLRLSDVHPDAAPLADRGLLISDHRARMLAGPRTAAVVHAAADLPWTGAVVLPLRPHGVDAGVLVASLPPEVTSLTEAESAFWAALADQAAVALAADELRAQVAAGAAALERRRLGRDLHDSVSQALFGVHQRAQVVERALAAGDLDLVRLAAQDLRALSGQALAELRELLGELRLGAVTQSGGLHAALTSLVADVRGREQVAVDLDLPTALPALGDDAQEHVYRIAREALHNAVKHADATRVRVRVAVQPATVVLSVEDDGRGFEPAAVGPGRHGQRTMRERAALCAAVLEVTSAPGRGTSVVVRVPLPRPTA